MKRVKVRNTPNHRTRLSRLANRVHVFNRPHLTRGGFQL